MFGDERASAKEISLFFVTSMSGLSGFRDNETGDARANVQSPHLRLFISRSYLVSSHTSNFSTVGQSDPEIRRLGARAHVHPHLRISGSEWPIVLKFDVWLEIQ